MDTRYGADEWSEQLHVETMDFLVDLARDTKHRYARRIAQLLE